MIKTSSNRIYSLDILKGLVMILMTLDHVRDFFHHDAFFFSPTDLTQTNPWLFLTRFVTHFCAPAFVLLAGTSANLVGRKLSKKALSKWLVKRGLWLIFLEFTVVKIGWTFDFELYEIWLLVIWALGAGMITLAAFIHLPKYVSLTFAALMILGHNALDGFHPGSDGFVSYIWKILHVQSVVELGRFTLGIFYPVIPWLGLMIAGFYLGDLYHPDFDRKRRLKILMISGVISLVAFVVLRLGNLYGEANHWSVQASPMFTFLSFINLTKYPPSLLYLFITMGPALILLSVAERINTNCLSPVMTIGRVPMFWYLVHLYVIHSIAILAAVLSGVPFSKVFQADFFGPEMAEMGYGFSLGVTYLFWIGITLIMYLLSVRYDRYKRNNRDKWWLSYL